MGRVLVYDIQGWITLILGGLLALITLFSSYSNVHIPFIGVASGNLIAPLASEAFRGALLTSTW